MNDNKYTAEFTKEDKSVAIIKLFENVLGGGDALDFANIVEECVKLGAKLIIADLKSVVAMNSSGLGMLVSVLSNLKNKGVALVLSSVPKKVMRLLELTHLNKVFTVYNNIDDAANHLN